MYDIFYVSKNYGNETDWENIKEKYPLAQRLSNVRSYEEVRSRSFTKMFWIIWDDIILSDLFNLTEYSVTKWDDMYVHIFQNGEYYDGVCLFPKNKKISEKEFHHRFFTDKKEININASIPKKYKCYTPSSYEEYEQISDEMFWLVWNEVTITDASVFDLYYSYHNSYDRRENHVFKNLCNDNESYLSGIVLCSKYKKISKKEFLNQYLIDKKEHDIVISRFQYPIHTIESYDEYLNIAKTENQKMFWCVWSETVVINQSVLNFYFDPNDGKYDHDRNENHVFLNTCAGNSSYLNGTVLFSKNKLISKKEFDRRYLIDKKEHDIVISRFQYPIHTIDSYDEYLNIAKTENQKMFWCVWPEIEVIDQSVFDFYFDPNDGKYDHDRNENHVFKNLCNNAETYLSGIVLFSKNKLISKKEFDRRYLIDKKEHSTVASRYRYSRYVINSYDEYLNIAKTENQKMFWCVWPEIEVIDQSVFDFYFDPNDGKYDHDRNENHTFSHLFNDTKIFVNGLVLFSKEKIIGQREFRHRFLIEKKEHPKLVSKHKPYDVVFISYNEVHADANYNNLLEICPRAKRIHKIKGIHQAHRKAAEICTTDMMWVIDGDAVVENTFNFDLVMSSYDIDCVHVWRSQNPINNLVYGNGGVKLLPRQLTLNMDVTAPDMTTSISKKFKAVQEISNITAFNTDQFTTWRSAFRECAKLASRVIDRQHEEETQQRLDTWCTVGIDKPFGKYAIGGAQLGRKYGEVNKHNLDELKKINDFDWLKEQFEKTYGG